MTSIHQSAVSNVEEPEQGTIAWTKWKHAQSPQDPAEYQRQMQEHKTAQFNDLRTGRTRPRLIRRIDYDTRLGAFTSQRRTRDPLHSPEPTVLAYTTNPQRGCGPTRSVTRPRPRGARPRRSSSSRTRSSSSDSQASEPGPGRWPGDESDELHRSFWIRVGPATWMLSAAAGGADRQLRFDQAGGAK